MRPTSIPPAGLKMRISASAPTRRKSYGRPGGISRMMQRANPGKALCSAPARLSAAALRRHSDRRAPFARADRSLALSGGVRRSCQDFPADARGQHDALNQAGLFAPEPGCRRTVRALSVRRSADSPTSRRQTGRLAEGGSRVRGVGRRSAADMRGRRSATSRRSRRGRNSPKP